MAEFEFAGVTFKGGRLFAILTALSTLGGIAWGGFEFYKDYMDMKEIIAEIDTDAIAARNNEIEIRLEDAISYTRDIKNDMKGDIDRIDVGLDKLKVKVEDSKQHVESTVEHFEEKTENAIDKFEGKTKNNSRKLRMILKRLKMN